MYYSNYNLTLKEIVELLPLNYELQPNSQNSA
jgi:hypothetical protein